MLKKKSWFKAFRKILYQVGLSDDDVEIISAGVKIDKLFCALTPKEAVNECISFREELIYADKSGS